MSLRLALSLSLLLAACAVSTEPELQGTLSQPLAEVPCRITMDISGQQSVIDMETDPAVAFDDDKSYVLNVVKCEHGGAPFEALKAQAVMARSLVFYRYHRYGVTTFGSGTSFQVYACNRTTTATEKADIKRAVIETRGEVLSWTGFVVWTSYVAGTKLTEPADQPGIEDDLTVCRQAGGTFNWDKEGCGITWGGGLPPTDPADCVKWPYVYNRGLAVQHGQSCLSRRGWKYGDILRFYYGKDSYLRPLRYACAASPPGPEDTFCAGKSTSGWFCVPGLSARAYCRGSVAEAYELCGTRCEAPTSGPAACVGGGFPPGADGGTGGGGGGGAGGGGGGAGGGGGGGGAGGGGGSGGAGGGGGGGGSGAGGGTGGSGGGGAAGGAGNGPDDTPTRGGCNATGEVLGPVVGLLAWGRRRRAAAPRRR